MKKITLFLMVWYWLWLYWLMILEMFQKKS